jgi:hypothetical protein
MGKAPKILDHHALPPGIVNRAVFPRMVWDIAQAFE